MAYINPFANPNRHVAGGSGGSAYGGGQATGRVPDGEDPFDTFMRGQSSMFHRKVGYLPPGKQPGGYGQSSYQGGQVPPPPPTPTTTSNAVQVNQAASNGAQGPPNQNGSYVTQPNSQPLPTYGSSGGGSGAGAGVGKDAEVAQALARQDGGSKGGGGGKGK